ncbi:MAG: glycosyltransferase [Actinomycetota bacterium]|nr:glycosyltransferase [Actinomycetota bacterium]
MRVLLWHGWLLDGSGSNVSTARLAQSFAASGHDVVLLCQEPHPERYGWIDAHGTVGAEGPQLPGSSVRPAPGRCVMLRPQIGSLLPVFVMDEYEGVEVKTFLQISEEELQRYLALNVEVLRAAAAWHGSEAVIAGHAIPGATIAARALGSGGFVAKVHGSDLEYAVRRQDRYLELAREGLAAARAVAGGSRDVLERCAELGLEMAHAEVIPPGVDVRAFRPRGRREALLEAAGRLDGASPSSAGRQARADAEVERALAARDAGALDRLARTYDQGVPDPEAAVRLRRLAQRDRPLVGYLGKLIGAKGPELVLAGAARSRHGPDVLVMGFGLHRERLAALELAMRRGDEDAIAWLAETFRMQLELPADHLRRMPGAVTFTGRLDHRFAPWALAAVDVLVVPSIVAEAFGMVATEGAATGALPLVARHSGLAEVGGVLETAVGRPGAFSFEPGPGAERRIADGIDALLSLEGSERDGLRAAVAATAAREWSWDRTASRLLSAAR